MEGGGRAGPQGGAQALGYALIRPAPALSLVLALSAGAPRQGLVRFSGPAPSPKIRKLHLDREACGLTHKDESLILGKKGALANVVVTWKGSGPATWTAPVTLTQKGCHYEPHILVLRPGQPLVILNRDPALHTTSFTSKLNRVKTQAQPKGAAPMTVAFSRPEVLRVYCDVHDWMEGWVIVTDDAALVTGRNGTFSLEGIPAGTKLNFWHEKLGIQEKILGPEPLDVAFPIPGSPAL